MITIRTAAATTWQWGRSRIGTIKDLQMDKNGLFAQEVFDSHSPFEGEPPTATSPRSPMS